MYIEKYEIVSLGTKYTGKKWKYRKEKSSIDPFALGRWYTLKGTFKFNRKF